MLFNYPKNWILVVKFLKTFIQPTEVGFVCVAANSIRPIRPDITPVFPERRRNDYSTTTRK